jgi:hypothetical protein
MENAIWILNQEELECFMAIYNGVNALFAMFTMFYHLEGHTFTRYHLV